MAKDYSILPIEQRLAVALHKHLCHASHIDQCGWEYSNDFDPKTWVKEYTHVEYLNRATNCLNLLRKVVPPESWNEDQAAALIKEIIILATK